MIIEVNPKSAYKVAIEEYKGKDLLNVRKLYKKESDTEWQYSKNGISFTLDKDNKELKKVINEMIRLVKSYNK